MKYLYIVLLISVSLACGVQSALPVVENTQQANTQAVVETDVKMVVIAESLNVRAGAGEHNSAELQGKEKGDVVTVYLSCTGGELRSWAAINSDCTRWVRSSYLAPVIK